MRLRRLELTRYGSFTGHVIDFGECPPGVADLHLIYGPNEAGKSTATAAFLDLLFGIEMRSRYGFQHPYASMRIGATLELAGGERHLIRIKRPQQSLLGPDDTPLPEGVLLGELGGMDRASYRAMFCLDDDTLEAGGEDILQSKGDVGHLLFAATAGLSDLSRNLERVRQNADSFYKTHARSGELADLKAELALLKDNRDKIDTAAAEYARLVDARDTSLASYNRALAEAGQIKTTLDAATTKRSLFRPAAELRRSQVELAELASLPDAPLSWLAELPDLERAETTLSTRLDIAQAALLKGTQARDGIVIDTTAEALSSEREQLEALRARHYTAELDLPARERELERSDADIAAQLRRLDQPEGVEPSRLLLTTRQQAKLSELIAARPTLAAKIDAGSEEYRKAVRRLEAAQTALGSQFPLVEHEPARLEAAVQAAQSGDHPARAQLAADHLAQAEAALSHRIANLRPWSGPTATLVELATPDVARIDSWTAALTRLDSERLRLDDEISKRHADQVRLQAELTASGEVVGLVSDNDAAQVRGAREQAWTLHHQSLIPDTGQKDVVFWRVERLDGQR